jgi:hypothetical protein
VVAFLRVLRAKIWMYLSPMSVTWSARFIFLDLIILIIFGEE